jgi:hypothetical protein
MRSGPGPGAPPACDHQKGSLMLRTPLRLLTASLIVASAAMFTVGVTIERHTVTSEAQNSQHAGESGSAAEPATPGQAGPGGDADHADSGNPGEKAPASEPASAHAAEQNSEKIFGVNPEATSLVVAAVLLSLLLAALILTLRSPLALAAAALAMAAFAGLDMFEVAHQLRESRSGLAALASTVGFVHLLAAAAALLAIAGIRRRATAR